MSKIVLLIVITFLYSSNTLIACEKNEDLMGGLPDGIPHLMPEGSGLSYAQGYKVHFDYLKGEGKMSEFVFAYKKKEPQYFKVPKQKNNIDNIHIEDVRELPYVKEMAEFKLEKPSEVVKETVPEAVKMLWETIKILHKYHIRNPSDEVLLKIVALQIQEEIKRRKDNIDDILGDLGEFFIAPKEDKHLETIYDFYVKQSKAIADNFFFTVIAKTLLMFDKESYFYNPNETKLLFDTEKGAVAVKLGTTREYPVVRSINEGALVLTSGLSIGDTVIKINGESTKGQGDSFLWLKLQGERGSKVRFMVLKKEGVIAVYQLDRVATKQESIETEFSDRILYVKFNQFNKKTEPELTKIIKNNCYINQQECKGLVLDLRDNEGGLLRSIEQTLNLFLSKGSHTFSIKNASGKVQLHKTWFVPRFPHMPVVILTSKWTTMGAEIFAGAMQHKQRAQILGEVTQGQVSIYRLIPFGSAENQVVVKVRTGQIMIGGSLLEGIGITPNVLLPQGSGRLPQRAKELLLN